ncbi:hypothetical protein EV126DRAFT_429184 [Verticillium dahliae]|nr:hypothetical protein EV126DRAFT_429184 [Verticillium dahliae]
MAPSVSSILNAPRKILDLRNLQPQRFSTQKTKAILSLLQWMLQYDVSKRPTVDQLLEHAWFKT